MKIYADVLILENSIVNFFLLTLTMKMIKHKCKIVALICSSIIGGIYTLVLIIPQLTVMTNLPCKLVVAYIMVRIAYGRNNIINNIKVLFVFLLVTFTLSGLCFLLSLQQNIYILGNSFRIEKYSIKYIMLGIMIVYVIYVRLIEYIRNKLFVNNYIFQLEFEIQDKKYNFKSFLDTGNELREPITNLPCILIEKNLIEDINFDCNNTYHILYDSIGYGGELKGVRINNVKLNSNKFLDKKIDAIICPCTEKLSKENEFNALLSRGVV